MKCQEYFYNSKEANEFMNTLNYDGANVELIESEDEDAEETVYIVNYNPPKM